MTDCGICLDVLRNPVAVPCGHVHCERCLRSHVNSGTDALRSACPTCRKPFHIATPDFAFVPQKYHDFILPPVRRIYMDIPSVARMAVEIDALTRRLEGLVKENDHLRDRCAEYKHRLEGMAAEKNTVLGREEEARQEAADLRRKYESLKKRYFEAQLHETKRSQSFSGRNSPSSDSSDEIIPKLEEHAVSLRDLSPNPPRPKRALPKSRVMGMRRKDDQASQLMKRQRTHRNSDDSSSSQLLDVLVKYEDEEEE